MPMPKTTMNKNDSPETNESNIGFAGNIFAMQAIAASANLAAQLSDSDFG